MAIAESTTENKTCTRCGEEKHISEFPLCRGKPRARCKPCHSKDAMGWVERNRERRLKYYKEWYKPHPIEPLSEDEKKRRRAEYNKRWREENKEQFDAMRRRWIENNPIKVYARTRKYQAAKRNASPSWANGSMVESFYAEAKQLTEETGVPHEVDHIVPITSKVVCGLHVEFNLQVIERSVNRGKHNRHWPDMPDEIEFRGKVHRIEPERMAA